MTLSPERDQHAFGYFSSKAKDYDAEYLLSYVLEYATYLSVKSVDDSYDEIERIIGKKKGSFQLFLSVRFLCFSFALRSLITQPIRTFVEFS